MDKNVNSSTSSLADGSTQFNILSLSAEKPTCTILFAAGAGGNPERHLPFLQSLATQGCNVIAPHFERILSSIPKAEDLLSRALRLKLANQSFSLKDMPVIGIGHSIGATLMLILAGGKAQTLAGEQVEYASLNLSKLALLAPATDFFRAPQALENVNIPIIAWVGLKDDITPPRQTEFLKDILTADVHFIEGAGHFSFMNDLPPSVNDPFPNRGEFLSKLADEIYQFALSERL